MKSPYKLYFLKSKPNSKGQVLVEYILLLAIAVSVSALMMAQIANRDIESPGFLIQWWNSIITIIAQDI